MQNKLFAPLKIGGIEIKNRIIMAPMCMYEVKKEDGRPRCFHKLHYASNVIGYRDQGDKYTFNAEYAFSRIDTLIGYNLIYFASKNTV